MIFDIAYKNIQNMSKPFTKHQKPYKTCQKPYNILSLFFAYCYDHIMHTVMIIFYHYDHIIIMLIHMMIMPIAMIIFFACCYDHIMHIIMHIILIALLPLLLL